MVGVIMARNVHDEVAQLAQQSPCSTVDDLFAPPARRIISRLLTEFLTNQKVSAVELLHRAELLDRLEGTGTLLQYVVQQTAVARAAKEKRPVQTIIKELNQLVGDLSDKVHVDKRNDRFPELKAEQFPALADDLVAKPDGAYILNGTLARYLRDARNWLGKIERLLVLSEMADANKPGGSLLISACDAIISEILALPAALIEVIDFKESFGEMVMSLVNLFLGRLENTNYPADHIMPHLTKRFASGLMPLSRSAIAVQIIAQIYNQQRLTTDSCDAELKMFRTLTGLMMSGVGDVLDKDELVEALELRAKRFVTSEYLNGCLAAIVLPSDKLEWLFFAEDCVLGERNKQILAKAAIRIATADSFKSQFTLTRSSLPGRLQRLTALCTKAAASGFHEADRRFLVSVFDNLAFTLAADNRLFETLAARPIHPVEKVLVLLQLQDARTFTPGGLSDRVRTEIIGYLARPGFLESYIERFKGKAPLSNEAAVAELSRNVRKVGLTPDELRELLAAA